MKRKNRVFFFLILSLLLSGCALARQTVERALTETTEIRVITAEGETRGIVPLENTVQGALAEMGITLSEADRVTPERYSPLTRNAEIRLVRVTHEDLTTEITLPFERQTVRNETLPDGETYLIQAGQNGLQERTTRITYEDGQIVSQAVTSVNTIEPALPEIVMLGAKAEYAPIRISGKLIYISNGNAWMMEGSTENRIPLVTSGDLDGRILDLSDNGSWLLYSRAEDGTALNSLWMKNIADYESEPVSLRVSNVIHFASWLPGDALRFLFSTVEPSDVAPGWKANNDLQMRTVSETGMLLSEDTLIEAESEGDYSWWGNEYHLSPDGKLILSAAPNAIQWIDRMAGEKHELLPVQPFEKTRSDWAWVPGIAWKETGDKFFFSYHGDINGRETVPDPAAYHIGVYDLAEGTAEGLVEKCGPFAYPAVSPVFTDGNSAIAYLQTLQPSQADAERYRIMVVSEDGGTPRAVYPVGSGNGYVTPQQVVWSPETGRVNSWLAFLTGRNVMLVNPFTGIYNQITSDGSITKIIWE